MFTRLLDEANQLNSTWRDCVCELKNRKNYSVSSVFYTFLFTSHLVLHKQRSNKAINVKISGDKHFFFLSRKRKTTPNKRKKKQKKKGKYKLRNKFTLRSKISNLETRDRHEKLKKIIIFLHSNSTSGDFKPLK